MVGSVTFLSEETPQRLALGALVHKLVVTELFGGGRTTMNVGPQPKPVSWAGRFFENVDEKVAAFETMLASGQEVLIAYGAQSWYGKVIDFTGNAAFLDTVYEITVELTRSATGTLTGASSISPDAQNKTIANAASGSMALITNPDVGAASLQAATSSLATNVGNTPLSTSSGTAVTALAAQVASVLKQAQIYVAGISSVDPRFLPVNSTIDSLTLLGANISAAETSASVSVTGGTMYDVAAQYCGDASKAYAIMVANGIYSPVLSTTRSTLIYIPQSLRSSANTNVAA
jgi:hypothetical protein